MVLFIQAIVFVLLCLHLTQGLRVTNIEVPRFIVVGDSATLKCHFILEGEKLYSLNWWKDDRVFYQYIPRNDPQKVVFSIPGVQVNEKKSTLYSVELSNIEKNSEGEYRCEVVGEAPTFSTNIRAENLSIIDPPDGPPVIGGQKHIYHPGEIIRLNCTSYRARPTPQLSWEVLSSSLSSLSSSSSSTSTESLLPPSLSFLKFASPIVSFLRTNSSLFLSSQSSEDSRSLTKSSSFSKQKFKNSNKMDVSDDIYLYSKTTKNEIRKFVTRKGRMKNESNYTKVIDKYLIKYPSQTLIEDSKKPVFSVTLGIQFPASLALSSSGTLTLRCEADIYSYKWATEVQINIAKVPVADPQQLPTLHGTGSHRGISCGYYHRESSFCLFAVLLNLIYLSKYYNYYNHCYN